MPRSEKRSRGRRKAESESDENVSPRGRRGRGSPLTAQTQKTLLSDSENPEDEDSLLKTREPRMSAQKLLTYSKLYNTYDFLAG